MERYTGSVVAVCKSSNHGYPTYSKESIAIYPWGIVGDAHSGYWRESFTKPGVVKINDRPFCIVAEEVYTDLNTRLFRNIQPGDFNEQLVVSGMGDLAAVPVHAKIAFENGVVLRVVDHAYPCTLLEDHNGAGLIKELVWRLPDQSLHSRRGILARVEEVGSRTIHPGERVSIFI